MEFWYPSTVTLGGSLDADSLQTGVLGIDLMADCPQEDVGLDIFALVGVGSQIARLTLDPCDLCLPVEFDAGVLHPRSESFLNGRVESSEDSVTMDEEMGLGSKAIEDTGKFDGNI